jgi:hypothetical protein
MSLALRGRAGEDPSALARDNSGVEDRRPLLPVAEECRVLSG